MDPQDLENLNKMLDNDSELREKIRDQITELDKKTRSMAGTLNKIHSTQPDAIPALVESIRPTLRTCRDVFAALADLVPPNQFWRWKDMWCNSLRTTVFVAALSQYLTEGTLISLQATSDILGMQDDWKDRVMLSAEDYLHGIISVVNELSRLAVNAVTMGSFEEPLNISTFVKEVFAGFSMLNLKNDTLRRRFDSLKYDLKKIEEELDCWSHAANSLSALSEIYAKSATQDNIGRVNRLITAWPSDDVVPAEGFDSLKNTYKKLTSALNEIKEISKDEIQAIDSAMERLGVLIALRKATESSTLDKRNKRPRASSPSSIPTPTSQQSTSNRGVSITLPARASPLPSFNKDPKARREALAKQLPLKEGRKVAFHLPNKNGTSADSEDDWILAIVTKCIQNDKNRYEVHDPEPQDNGEPGLTYQTTLRNIIPLPDPSAPPGSASSLSAYKEFPAGSTVIALYPDTSVFYRAEVIATPKDTQPSGRGNTSYMPTYKVKFEDDDNQEHLVSAQWVVEWPATSKVSETGQNGRFMYAVSEMQGWRITMEDAHAIVLDLDEKAEDPNAFFAVYDGHGGDRWLFGIFESANSHFIFSGGTVAKFAGQNVHKRLKSEETYQEKDYETALKKAFLGTDEDLLANPAHARDPSGCTAVAALVTKDKIYVANAGDSRSVLSVKGEAKPLSFDHKPTNETEKARITGAGGYVEYGRVNGNLALSRAIGDFDFKKNYSLTPEKQVITSNPDVTVHDITEEDEFIVLACDGIWDCLTSQQVMDFVRLQVSEGKELKDIAEMMCDHCLAPDTSSGAGIGCDNMTVLIAAILHGRTKEEWYAWITDRVKNGYGYKTPSSVPQLYATSRLMSFKARREAQEARERQRTETDDNGVSAFLESSGLSGFARVLGSTGGISFHPGSGILSDGRGLMFTGDDSGDEDDSEDDGPVGGKGFFTETLGLGSEESSSSSDPMKNLKAQLDEYDWDEEDPHHANRDSDSEGDAMNVEETNSTPNNTTQTTVKSDGEAPPPPKELPNGDAKSMSPVPQLKSEPGGDKASAVVEAEGLMDTSEDPLKA
ncbi:Protein phosphatase 2C 2 [Paramarasmius palmivorus]|uniref:protein-serine/threonine phosphatase n=1 Tax=Paramarasmius palmivorus TaxID=297713 RepID=A0AAW0DY34_9AGAR